MLANVIEIFQNAYHVDLHFMLRRRDFFLYTLYLPSAEAYSEPFKHLRWSVFACPVNDLKLLTVYAKALPLICLKRF